MLNTCADAGFAVQPSKVTAPATQVKFLGITIDTVAGTLSIDRDRLDEVIDLVTHLLALRSVTKRRLLSVIGKLAFASRVVRTGRAFLGRLIDASKTARHLHFSVKVTREVRADLEWWRDCVKSHNGVSLIPPPGAMTQHSGSTPTHRTWGWAATAIPSGSPPLMFPPFQGPGNIQLIGGNYTQQSLP